MVDPNTPQQHSETKPALPTSEEQQGLLPSTYLVADTTKKKPLRTLTRTEDKISTAKNISKVFNVGAGISLVTALIGGYTFFPPLFIVSAAAGIICLGIADYAKVNQLKNTSTLLKEEDVVSSIQLLLKTPEQTRWALQNLPHIRNFTQQYYQLNAVHILTTHNKTNAQFPSLRKDQLAIYRLRKQIDAFSFYAYTKQNTAHKWHYYTSYKKEKIATFFNRYFHKLFSEMPKDDRFWAAKRNQEAFAVTFAYLRLILYLGAPAYQFTPDILFLTWANVESRYQGKNGFMSGDTATIRETSEMYYQIFLPDFVFTIQKHTNFDDFFTAYVNQLTAQVSRVSSYRYEKIIEYSTAAFFSACVVNKQVDPYLFKNTDQAMEHSGLPALQFYLQRNPEQAYNALQNHPSYANHFLTSAKQGLAVLREQHLTTSYFTQLSFFQDPSTFHIPVAVSVHDLPKDTQQRFLNVLQAFRATLTPHVQKNLRTAEQKLSFSVWLAGYACFFADVLTPTVDLGPQFLQAYLQDLQKELYIPPAQIPQFLELFQKAFFCFAEPAEAIFTAGDVPTILESYAQLFMASAGVASTLLQERLLTQTAALLPACEMALQPDDL